MKYERFQYKASGWAQEGLETFVHGDLNARNFLWGTDETLTGIVDFASTCKGSVFAEALPFLTGTVFVDGLLRLDRVITILASLRGQCGIQISRLEMVELACLVAAGFFGRVNKEVIVAEKVEWRDARRARAIFDRRFEIAALIDV